MVLRARLTGVLYRMSFDPSSMECGELCHNRYVCLLLAEYMQDVGAAKPNAKTRCTCLGLKSGV